MLQLHSVTESSSGSRTWNLKALQWQFPGYFLRGGVEGESVWAAIDDGRWKMGSGCCDMGILIQS